MIFGLYSLDPTIAFQNNSVYLRVYSKELVRFKNRRLGLPIGPKVDLRIPEFCSNTPDLTCQLISGLYDTDGSVKIRRSKSGDYPRISLGQKHKSLVKDTGKFLQSLGITSTMYRNDYDDPRSGKTATRWFLDINGFRNFDLFFSEIGTRSPYVEARMNAAKALK
jgi:hypothetical protein